MRLNIIFSTITLSLLILSFPFVTNADTIKIENAGALVGMVANISEDLNNDDSDLVAQDIAEEAAQSGRNRSNAIFSSKNIQDAEFDDIIRTKKAASKVIIFINEDK